MRGPAFLWRCLNCQHRPASAAGEPKHKSGARHARRPRHGGADRCRRRHDAGRSVGCHPRRRPPPHRRLAPPSRTVPGRTRPPHRAQPGVAEPDREWRWHGFSGDAAQPNPCAGRVGVGVRSWQSSTVSPEFWCKIPSAFHKGADDALNL